MRTEQGYQTGYTDPEKTPQMGGHAYSAAVTNSDTIRVDSRVPFLPFWEERRQTEHAVQWSAKIPCFRNPHSTIDFPFWIQPVAAVSEELLRLLKTVDSRPDKAGGKMANYCQDSLHLQVFSTGIPQTQDAASMANPEVTTCR